MKTKLVLFKMALLGAIYFSLAGTRVQAAAGDTAYVTGQTLTTLRNDYTGWIGMKITVGAANVTLTELGRWVVSGNSQPHTVKVVVASSGADLAGASVSIATAGAPAGFKYATLGSPVTLSANTAYYIVSSETAGGDQWYHSTTAITTTSAATCNNPIYWGSTWTADGTTANRTFGPVSFKYSTSAAFVTGQTLTTLRNDYTGWIGMKVTVGAANVTLTELGRWVVSGNNQPHTVKVVVASSGADLPGASVSIATAGAPAGFKYATLGSPVTLSANTAYYIVTSETAGSDQWYHSTTAITTTSAATCNNPIYWGTGWTADGTTANRTFGPVSFKYSTGGGGAPAAPTALLASGASNSQINLSWTDNANNETGFKIERKTGAGGTYAQIATAGANVTTYNNNTGLTPNTQYYYRVRATNAAGDSAYSSEANAWSRVGPAGYTWCADEGGTVSFTNAVDVAYGANGSYAYRINQSGSITFNNTTFGDPISGAAKAGYYKPGGVTFYADINYTGAAGQVLQPGNYTTSQLQAAGVLNNTASSCRIPGGWTVIVYQDDNFTGTVWTLTSDTPNFTLQTALNDAMSSCRISVGWSDEILNSDGTINWIEYANVANSYNQRDTMDYRFGPKYAFYHSTPETIPTMYSNSDANGWHNGGWKRQPTDSESVEWYSEGGQFLLSPDAGAPTEWLPGVAQCWNGGIWGFKDPIEPKYSLLNHLTFDTVISQFGSRELPDPGPVSQAWINASGGTVPAPPVTVARTHAASGVTGFMIFNNGLIGVCGTGNDYYHWGVPGYLPRASLKLPSGKVPTAAAVTGCQEFLLVTVWDTVNHKGQIAVIAINGPIVRTFDCMPHENRPSFWGLPNWPGVKSMKLLGYVDLPFAAPTAINISQDFIGANGRGFCDNLNFNLDTQAERDKWYNWTGGEGKKTARCGYAVVSSRAENKVAFIDLQPLFQYYRTMYFTSQANYDLTKNQGAADNQWPYAFTYASSQKPTVYATKDVSKPTAVAAGLPNSFWPPFRNGDAAKENAYVATMDGSLLMYKVGDLMTTASGGTIGAPFNSITIGKNPSSIHYGWGGGYGDDLYITCRGDNALYYLYSDGSTRAVLRDSRIQDAVSVGVSGAGRCFRNACWGSSFIHLMDFTGRKVLNYRFHSGYPDSDNIPVGSPPNPPNRSTIFEFSDEQTTPGQPFFFISGEVI